MGLLERIRKQTAVYWAPSTGADRHGRPQYGDAVELSCRWESTMVEFIGPEGTRELSTAVVYLGVDVGVGGVLMLGALADVELEGDPKANPDAHEIRRFEKLPNIRQTKILRRAYL